MEQIVNPKEDPTIKTEMKSSATQSQQRPKQDDRFSGVLEFSFQQRGHVPSMLQTNSTQWPSGQPLPSAVYESNINYNLSSKWIFNDICRIVCNKKGFYVNIYKTRMFVKINELNGESPSGSIWVKRPNLQGWSKIIHSTSTVKEVSVGYIKQGGEGLLYKLSLKQTSYMTIKTR